MIKPVFPPGGAVWWRLPRHRLTKEQLEAKREYDRKMREFYRQSPEFKERDRSSYFRCINKDRSKVYARNKRWRKQNWSSVLESRRKAGYKLASQMRCRIRKAIKVQKAIKSARLLVLLGCNLGELKEHLEALFKPGMCWDNYGPVWHIDHVRPCSSFNLSSAVEQKLCFHFSNLQPLFAHYNLTKAARWHRG